ncbi:hypothetical protein ACFX2C_023079 [Malus domestica]
MVYESFSTEDDVVLFTKVLDNRQGINRPPTEFRCMFGDTNDKSNAVRTAVMSSVQEVFRCHHPNVTAVNSNIKFSLEIVDANVVVPPVAYYSPSLDKINSVEQLGEMEDSLRESLNQIRTHKENLQNQQIMSLQCTSQVLEVDNFDLEGVSAEGFLERIISGLQRLGKKDDSRDESFDESAITRPYLF